MFKKYLFPVLVFLTNFILLSLTAIAIRYPLFRTVNLLVNISLSFILTIIIIRGNNNEKLKTLKTKYIRVINVFICLLILLTILLTPFFQSSWFYIRHIVIFTLIAFLLVFNGYLMSNKFINKYPSKLNKIKVISLLSIFIAVLLFGNLQIFYIKNYEIPQLYGCSYYDDYGNLIYNSQIAGSCPLLKDVIKEELADSRLLSFSVSEEIYRKDKESDDKYVYESHITYKYDSLNRIINYEIKHVISGYSYINKEYKLYRKTDFSRIIENIYEENRVISNHKVVNIHTNNGEISESLSYDIDIIYISELIPKVNPNEYLIQISTSDGNLFTVDAGLSINGYYYIIRKDTEDEFIVLSAGKLGIKDDYYIDKEYRTKAYGMIKTDKKQRFIKMDSLYFNNFTKHEPQDIIEVNVKNYIINISDGSYTNRGFYNFTNIMENTNYGFKIKHYHLQRDNYLRLKKYKQTVDYSIDYPNNKLSVALTDINNYKKALYYPDMYPFELIYQDNPLLMRSYVEKN